MTLTSLPWVPVTDHFGAEVSIDLNDDLSPSSVEDLRHLFNTRSLLVFRNQKFDYSTQRNIVSIFGDVLDSEGDAKYVSTIHDLDGNPLEVAHDVEPRAVAFHCDNLWLPSKPIRGISLFAELIEDGLFVEGTRFVSNQQGYRDLPEQARNHLTGRMANHLHSHSLTVEEQMQLRDLPFDEAKQQVDFWSQHPLFYSQPGWTEPALLYVPWFTHSIEGLDSVESKKWFKLFDDALYSEGKVFTHKWREGDFVIWDNLALQHSKEPGNGGPVPKRVLRRAIMGTEQPKVFYADYGFENERSKRVNTPA